MSSSQCRDTANRRPTKHSNLEAVGTAEGLHTIYPHRARPDVSTAHYQKRSRCVLSGRCNMHSLLESRRSGPCAAPSQISGNRA
jgi:hypothetical protein